MAVAGLPTGLLDEAAWGGKIHSDGWVAGRGGDYSVVEPATGSELGRMGLATPEDVHSAAQRATEAQRSWARTGYQERAAILRKAGDLWNQHAEEIQRWIQRETGAILPKGQLETWFAASTCYEAAGLCSLPYGELLQTRDPLLSMSRRVPLGVVGVISPFNFPLILSIRAVAPALALCNAVILKPDPRTAVSGGVTLARIFDEAGVPEGVFHVLPGGADVGEAIISDPGIAMISFTGSTRTGRAVATLGGKHLKKIHLELGGNNVMIVLDDVDVERAVSVGAWGSYVHQGQVCMTTGRHLVQRSIADEYVARLSEHANHLPVGDPMSGTVALGPIIDAGQRDRVHNIVTQSVAAGARLAAGGTYENLVYRPTVLADVPLTSPAYTEEIFGPVAPVVAFDSIDDAVAMASDNEYGLSLGILTSNPMRGLEIADRIPVGIVHINDQTISDEVVNPFGGIKASGPGARLGGARANLDAFTQTQWVTLRGDLPQYPM
jgi:benzaldehyde dehydrogenase (NAD)